MMEVSKVLDVAQADHNKITSLIKMPKYIVFVEDQRYEENGNCARIRNFQKEMEKGSRRKQKK